MEGVKSPYNAYLSLVDDKKIALDKEQEKVIRELEVLHETLSDYSHQMGKKAWHARLRLGRFKKPTPKGLYIWGGVGCGKTMLMDLFFSHCAVDKEQKKHVHFHAFMQEVHKRLHTFREAQKAGKVPKSRDPITALSKVIVDRAWLLCFDEFHITDIADAMILGRLFENLFERGVVIVATSNRHPTDLYRDGLQRQRFLPFIKIFMDRMRIFEFDNGIDYRLEKLRSINVYLISTGTEASAQLGRAFDKLSVGMSVRPRVLFVNGREIRIAKTVEGIAYTNFPELCQDFFHRLGLFYYSL